MFEEGAVPRRLEAGVKPSRALQSTLTALSWSPGHRRLGSLNVPVPDHALQGVLWELELCLSTLTKKEHSQPLSTSCRPAPLQ